MEETEYNSGYNISCSGITYHIIANLIGDLFILNSHMDQLPFLLAARAKAEAFSLKVCSFIHFLINLVVF